MAAVARFDRIAQPPMSVGAFQTYLEQQADPCAFELVGGAVVMMANPTETHNQMAGNIFAPLKLAMDQRRGRTYQSDMRVQRTGKPTDEDQPRPDIVVRCGAHTGKTFITDPIIVVEVFSPSTMSIDRGPKLDFYMSLQTTCHVALVDQDQMRVEHDRRTDTGWDLEVLRAPTDVLDLSAVAFRIPLETV
jgi:Uma2 family endonuclease